MDLMYKGDKSGFDDLDTLEMRKRAKKIEFSQSIGRNKLDKELLFTHSKLDQLVFSEETI